MGAGKPAVLTIVSEPLHSRASAFAQLFLIPAMG